MTCPALPLRRARGSAMEWPDMALAVLLLYIVNPRIRRGCLSRLVADMKGACGFGNWRADTRVRCWSGLDGMGWSRRKLVRGSTYIFIVGSQVQIRRFNSIRIVVKPSNIHPSRLASPIFDLYTGSMRSSLVHSRSSLPSTSHQTGLCSATRFRCKGPNSLLIPIQGVLIGLSSPVYRNKSYIHPPKVQPRNGATMGTWRIRISNR